MTEEQVDDVESGRPVVTMDDVDHQEGCAPGSSEKCQRCRRRSLRSDQELHPYASSEEDASEEVERDGVKECSRVS